MTTLLEQYGPKMLAELQRRGWARGEYAATIEYTWNEEYEDEEVVHVPVEDCKVCLAGAAGAAYFGNPNLGVSLDHPEYTQLLDELADKIRPGWREEMHENYNDEVVPRWRRSRVVVTTWNDEEASYDDVLALLGA